MIFLLILVSKHSFFYFTIKVIRKNNGKETETEYFAALVFSFELLYNDKHTTISKIAISLAL